MSAPARPSTIVKALVLATMIAVVLTACGSEGTVETTEAPDDEITAADIRAGTSGFLHLDEDLVAPGFALTNQNGQTVALSDFRGKWVVMDWIYTNCMTVCPAFTAELNIVRNGLEAPNDQVQFVSITFDPERDTQEVLKAHAAKAGADAPDWSWLTGSKVETDAVAAAYGLSYEPGEPMNDVAMFDHTALLVIVDPQGTVKHRYLGTGWAGEVLDLLTAEVAVAAPADTEDEPPPAEPAELGVFGPEATALLGEAKALHWEDWELEPGVTAQALYQFANTGKRTAFIDQVRADVAVLGITPVNSHLSAMRVDLIDWNGELFTGLGYFDNLVVVVKSGSADPIAKALAILDNEWCCGSPP